MAETLTLEQRQRLIETFRSASPAEQGALLTEVDRTLRKAVSDDPALHFPVHPQQEKFLEHSEDVNICLGGNRSGKTTAGKLRVANILRRRDPIIERLKLDTETGLPTRDPWRPLEGWIGCQSLDKFRQDWLNPADPTIGIMHFLGDMATADGVHEHPDLWIQTKRGDKLVVKSYEQGFKQFESSEVDFILLDEEPPDIRIVNSSLMRLATSNGVLLLTYTPLDGFTWSWHRYVRPITKLGRGKLVSDREWVGREGSDGRTISVVQMGMADNPRARDAAIKLEADPGIAQQEKAARLYGEYGFTEGVFLTRLAGMDLVSPAKEHEIYIVDKLPPIVRWYLIADPNYRSGAILTAQDGDYNHFFCRQHLEESWVTKEHAAVFKGWMRDAPNPVLLADMGSAGKYATSEYHVEGLPFQPVEKGADSVVRSIKKLRDWSTPDPKHVHPITGERGAPRIYFYRPWLREEYEEDGIQVTGSRLIEQLGSARQTDDETARPDTPHKTQKHSLDLFDCARYLALMAQPVPLDEGTEDRRPMNKVIDLLPSFRERQRKRARYDPENPEFAEPEYEEALPWN